MKHDATTNELSGLEIAVIGLACRFPGCDDAEQFWKNLRAGVCSIARIDRDELNRSPFDPVDWDSSAFVPAAAALHDIEKFDAGFFGFAPREAQLMDPQQRIFLEVAWHALEDAAIDPHRHDGSIGVAAGATLSRYLYYCLNSPDLLRTVGADSVALGNNPDFLTTMLSYKLNLQGPSVAVQTACSTSLVAVHVASQMLLNREADVCLAGGVAIRVPQKTGYLYKEGGFLSPDGSCRTFDADARGTVFGDGVGVVVLQRLADALRTGSRIRAIIRGSAVNNDGRRRAGFTAPSVSGQTNVILQCQGVAGVPVESIAYVEAHGTGTPVGDPIEFTALTNAFRQQTTASGFCAIGSVKPNIGHADAAAGIAGLIKTILMLEHKEIPPTIHFVRPNPQIALADSPFYINTTVRSWEKRNAPMRAAVSSFGIGGTNAHVILEEAPKGPPRGTPRTTQILPVSARDRAALDAACEQLAVAVRQLDDSMISDVAYTLAVGRAEFEHRVALVCDSRTEAIQQLEELAGEYATAVIPDGQSRAVFMFSGAAAGQGGPAGHELYRSEAVFRTSFDECLHVLRSLGADAAVCPRRPDEHSASSVWPVSPISSQLALFALQYSLAKLWVSWGVVPVAVIGCPGGEHAAACVAGILSLEEALCQLIEPMRAPRPGPNCGVREIARKPLTEPGIAYISGLTGCRISRASELESPDPSRLPDAPLSLADAVRSAGEPNPVLLEVGLGDLLCRQAAAANPRIDVPTIPSLSGYRDTSETRDLLKALARAWQHGVAVDWSAFHATRERCRIALPRYAFTRTRYWIDADEAPRGSRATQSYYLPTWNRNDQQGDPTPLGRDEALWLLFADAKGIADGVALQIRNTGGQVLVVRPGRDISLSDSGNFSIRADRREDYTGLCNHTVRLLAGRRLRVAHFWSIDSVAPEAGDALGMEPMDYTFYGGMHLVQALCETNAKVALWFVSEDVQTIIGDELVSPARATLLGLSRVVTQEHGHVKCRFVDVHRDGINSAASLAVLLYRELRGDSDEILSALRNGQRWLPSFERTAPGPDSAGSFLRRNGVYLITGGLGRFGLAVARYLTSKYDATVILTSRRQFPQQGGLQQLPDPRTSARMREMAEMCAAGAQVEIAQADAGSEAQLATLVADVLRRHGHLHGIIHAAGLVGDEAQRAILELDDHFTRDIFSAKVLGVRALAKVLGPHPTDFILLVSSLSPILGGLGLAAYAAANQYMDSFAARAGRLGDRRWLSVNWEGWTRQDNATPAGGLGRALAGYAMDDEEIAAGLEVALGAMHTPRLVIAKGNMDERIQQWTTICGLERTIASPSRLAGNGATEVTDMVSKVREIVRGLIGVDNVGEHDNLFELGASSLTAVQLAARLREQFQINLPLRTLFESPTIAGLCAAVRAGIAPADSVQKILEEAESLSDEEARALLPNGLELNRQHRPVPEI